MNPPPVFHSLNLFTSFAMKTKIPEMPERIEAKDNAKNSNKLPKNEVRKGEKGKQNQTILTEILVSKVVNMYRGIQK